MPRRKAPRSTAKPNTPIISIGLDRNLDITAAKGLRGLLIKASSQDGDVIIDGSSVERIGTPCIQLLITAERELRQNSRAFILTNPSEALGRALDHSVEPPEAREAIGKPAEATIHPGNAGIFAPR